MRRNPRSGRRARRVDRWWTKRFASPSRFTFNHWAPLFLLCCCVRLLCCAAVDARARMVATASPQRAAVFVGESVCATPCDVWQQRVSGSEWVLKTAAEVGLIGLGGLGWVICQGPLQEVKHTDPSWDEPNCRHIVISAFLLHHRAAVVSARQANAPVVDAAVGVGSVYCAGQAPNCVRRHCLPLSWCACLCYCSCCCAAAPLFLLLVTAASAVFKAVTLP